MGNTIKPSSVHKPTNTSTSTAQTQIALSDTPTPTPPPSTTPIPSATNTQTATQTLLPATPTFTPTITLTPPPTQTPTAIQNPSTIGYSLKNRPLEVYQFGAGPIERMIVAGIHGGYEWNTSALAHQLIAYLDQNPDIVPPDTTLFILPIFNPDGHALSTGQKENRTVAKGRSNAHGVDLNRNWNSHWAFDWNRTGCWALTTISAGPYPSSEPETLALMQFILSHHIDALISYHSAGLGIFPGGQPPTNSSLTFAQQIANISQYPYPPKDTGCQFTGQLIDWTAEQGLATVDIELTNHHDTDFDINIKILDVLLSFNKP